MRVFSIHMGASSRILDPHLFAFYSPLKGPPNLVGQTKLSSLNTLEHGKTLP